jgi:hypothetical protein
MRLLGITHARLMEESECRIENVARDGNSAHAHVAQRILDDTKLYRLWESEHNRIMRNVAAESRGQGQVAALRSACFGLIHRKAMFEFLRQQKITGRDRHAVFALVFGEHDYVRSVLLEHANYLRSTSSLLCSNHLGLSLLEDRAFGEPLWRYEQLYADYFRAFCGTALTSDPYSSADTLSTLLPYLKRQLADLRRVILALPSEPELALHNMDFTAPAANTQRLYQSFRVA